MKTISRNAFFAGVRSITQTIFPLIVFAYASRVLNPAGIGIINFSNSFVGYFVLFAGLGISKYGTREAALVRDDRKEISKLFVELNILNLFMTIIAIIAYCFIINIVERIETYRICLYIYGFAIPFSGLAMEWLYYGLEEYEYITKRIIVFRIMGLMSTLIFVRSFDDIWKFAIIQVLSNYGNYATNFFRSRKYISLKEVKIKELNISKHIIPVATLFAAQISYTLYSNTDVTMLGLMTSETSVGIYSVASKLTHIMLSSTEIIISVFLPRMVNFYNRGNYELIIYYREKIIRIFYIIAFPIILLFWVVGQEIVLIFAGSGYKRTYNILCILVVDLLLFAIRVIYETTYLIPMKKEKVIAFTLLVSAMLNVVLNFFLIPICKGEGAALASVIAELLIACIYCLYGIYKKEVISIYRYINKYAVAFFVQLGIFIIVKRMGVATGIRTVGIYLFLIVFYIVILMIQKDKEVYSLFATMVKYIKKRK